MIDNMTLITIDSTIIEFARQQYCSSVVCTAIMLLITLPLTKPVIRLNAVISLPYNIAVLIVMSTGSVLANEHSILRYDVEKTKNPFCVVSFFL